jgi:ATP-dependent Clp protease ATP-binding subunit ClpA
MIDDPLKEDTVAFREQVKIKLTDGVKAYFNDNGRPELLNRLGEDNIVVFQFINVQDAMVICDYKLSKICKSIKTEKGIDIKVDEVMDFLHKKAVLERANGGRGVGNMLEREFLNPLASYICTLSHFPSTLKCHVDDDNIIFEDV